MQAYSNPERESDPYALPDVEIFFIDAIDTLYHGDGEEPMGIGWYWQACFPGCLPDGEPNGPYANARDAMNAAQEDAAG